MHNDRSAVLAALLLIALPAASLARPPSPKAATVVVKTTSRSETLDAQDLAAMSHVTVKMSIHDELHVFEGVPLSKIFALVNVPSGENLRGQALANAVIVHSRDNCEIVLALAETDPSFHKDAPILADRMDGKAIDDKEGPFRLVVPGELKPARSAKMVDRIEIRPLGSR